MTETSLVMSTSIVIMFILLVHPLMPTSTNPSDPQSKVLHVKESVARAFFISLLPLFMFLSQGNESVITTWQWAALTTLEIKISLKFDLYSTVFTPIALLVTWSVMDFASWYMHEDPDVVRFFKYLLVFLISMVILVTANNMFQLFIGWEGVGIMSFLLIGWWGGRPAANTSALKAVLYNRAGDAGFIFMLAWMATQLGSWDLDQIYSASHNTNMTPPLLALIIAASGKSAQFGLHPWLPAAMEGPTPVSALLHSSTMVVAGIFMLVRISPLMENNTFALTTCLCLGAMTTVFNAGCALAQNDLKKIIAFSTASQLGLMMVAVGLAQPQLAFFHICTHAFFKAALFICAGSFIHSLNNDQDIRKMGGMFHLAPFTSSCLVVASLALAGTPFLAGFFSKDAIIEALNTSSLNTWALAVTLIATCFTAVYSLRVILFVTMGFPRFLPLSPINENDHNLTTPLKRLAYGSIIAGFVLSLNMIFPKTPVMTMSLPLKMAALLVTALGLIVALDLAKLANKQFQPSPKHPSPLLFSHKVGFYQEFVLYLPVKILLSFSQYLADQLIDRIWLEKSGPKAVSLSSLPLITSISNAQRGVIMTFLAFFFITLVISLLTLLL